MFVIVVIAVVATYIVRDVLQMIMYVDTPPRIEEVFLIIVNSTYR